MDRSQPTNLFRTEPTMADQPRDTGKPKTKPQTKAEEKAPETVMLTPEELRAISGGATTLPPAPKPNTTTKI
jgi:hypothetical protein